MAVFRRPSHLGLSLARGSPEVFTSCAAVGATVVLGVPGLGDREKRPEVAMNDDVNAILGEVAEQITKRQGASLWCRTSVVVRMRVYLRGINARAVRRRRICLFT